MRSFEGKATTPQINIAMASILSQPCFTLIEKVALAIVSPVCLVGMPNKVSDFDAIVAKRLLTGKKI